MKSKLILAILICLLLLVGCSSEPYIFYRKALDKTASYSSGRENYSIKYSAEFVLKNPEYKLTENISEMASGSANFRRSYSNGLNYYEGLVNIAGYGFPFRAYVSQDKSYVISPILDKILLISAEEMQLEYYGITSIDTMPKTIALINDTVLPSIRNMVEKDDVMRLGSVIVQTPEGDIKTREYSIRVKEESILPIIGNVAFRIRTDEELAKELGNLLQVDGASGFDVVRDILLNLSILEYSLYAYVDIDGRLISEEVKVRYKIRGENLDQITTFEMKITYFDLGEEIEIYFPIVDRDNVITIDQLDMFKGDN